MSKKNLSELQMAVMRVLWDRGEATTAEIYDDVGRDRDLAPTTVATVVSRLAKQGVIDFRSEGRQYVYRPVLTEMEARRSMVSDFVAHVFDGDPAALVSHLLHETSLEDAEIDRLRSLIAEQDDDPRPEADHE